MPEETIDDLPPEMQAQFGKFLEQHEAQKAKEAAKAKPPKDAAELIDRIADSVWDRFEERRKAADAGEGDDPPRDAGEGKGGILGAFFGGGS